MSRCIDGPEAAEAVAFRPVVVCLLAAIAIVVHAGKTGAQTSEPRLTDSQVSDSLRGALGAEIRLYTASSEPVWIRGTLKAVSASAITLEDAHGSRPINLADIVGAERYAGRPRWKGALVGLAVGIGAGVIIGYAIGANDDRNGSREAALAGTGGLFGGIEGGVVGGVLGPVVGVVATPEEWQVLIPHR